MQHFADQNNSHPRHRPYATVTLIGLCLLAAVWLQDGDQSVERQAALAYQQLQLSPYELPFFINYLDQKGDAELRRRLDAASEAQTSDMARHWIDLSPSFLDAMWAGQFLPVTANDYRRWQERRTRYDSVINASLTQQLQLKFDQPGIVPWVSHPFLSDLTDNGWWLVLAMLLLAGLLLERMVGTWPTALSWIALTVGAAAVALAAESNRLMVLIGPDAAVSGFLTLAMAIAVWRKRMPTLLVAALLGVTWLAFLFAWRDSDDVSLWWHLGGVGGAALMAGLLYLLDRPAHQPGAAPSAAHHPTQAAIEPIDDHRALQSARELMQTKNYALALAIADEVLGRSQDTLEAWEIKVQATLADDLTDDENPAHALIEQIVIRKRGPEGWNRFAISQFEHYMRWSKGKPRLSLRAIMALSQRYMAAGKMESAQRLFAVVERKAPDAPPVRRLRKLLNDRASTA